MKASDFLEKAGQLIARGDEDHAEAHLNDAIELAASEGERVILTRARLSLAELLCAQERQEEADPLLRLVIRTEIADGSVHPEVKRAAALLAQLRGWPTH